MPFLFKQIFIKRRLFTKNTYKETLAFFAPFIVVAAGVMFYNHIRFGSPFDFGANYNLTTNDMTKRGFVLGRSGLALFTYFLQSLTLNAKFPFLHPSEISTSYSGTTIFEPMYGGILAATPFLWLLFLQIPLRRELKSEKLAYIVGITSIMAVVISIINAQSGGLLQRYFSDFGYLLCIGAAIMFLFLNRIFTSKAFKKLSACFISFSIAFSACYCLLLVFADSYTWSMFTQNPHLWFFAKYLFSFWM
ncbi:MAG: hypothetical protein LBS74_10380 [Oscillospiraceae bacterium]|nr:hypothetical protein [Oscillospiraceae bacterium]